MLAHVRRLAAVEPVHAARAAQPGSDPRELALRRLFAVQ
jgi:hypothetical protein